MAPLRKPRGYLGGDHLTLGTDIIAVLKSISMAQVVLGPERTAALSQLVPTQWYPISALLEPLEFVGSRLGTSTLKKIGWNIFKLSHAEAFRQNATCVRDLAYGIDGLYHHANRGTHIGGWVVKKFVPGLAVLEKTTPHHCVVEEGILEEGLRTLNVPAVISQSACFRKGAEACVFELQSHVQDERWGPAGAK